jgi:predicted Zn-dependent protease
MRATRILTVILGVLAIALLFWGWHIYEELQAEERLDEPTAADARALADAARAELLQRYGGLDPDQLLQKRVRDIGLGLVAGTAASTEPYGFTFEVLADSRSLAAFALPGGDILVTSAVVHTLKDDDDVAGFLAHELGHAIAHHDATAVRATRKLAYAVSLVTDPRYEPGQEEEADHLAVHILAEAGYDPKVLLTALTRIDDATGIGAKESEFGAAHPSPGQRAEHIEAAIEDLKAEQPVAH